MEASRPDVIVVGGGIVACAVSLRFAHSGVAVVMVAPRTHLPGTATLAAGAMLGALGETTPGEPSDELDLRLEAHRRWSTWAKEFEGHLALRRGTFVVASAATESDLAGLAAIKEAARSRGIAHEEVEPCDVPGLAPAPGHAPQRALLLGEEAWVNPSQVVDVARDKARATGRLQVIDDLVVGVIEHAGAVHGVRTRSRGELQASWVVLCAGSEVSSILDASGLEAVMPRVLRAKGVGLTLSRTERPLGGESVRHVIRTPNRAFACGLHVVPQDDSIYLGATNRLSRWEGMTGDVTAGELMTLLRAGARELNANLPTWNVTDTRFGNRPLSVDGLPIVGQTDVEGLMIGTGTYRNGVLLAPLIADRLHDEFMGSAGDPRITPKRTARFAITPGASEVFAAGLADYARLIRDPDDPPTQPSLDLLLATLGRLVLDESPRSSDVRQKLRSVLTEHPLREMLPEIVIEMCNPELLD